MKEKIEITKLRIAAEEITKIAEGFGLKFGEVCFEVCPADVIYSVGAYGMPSRFSHWSFGKTFHKMKLLYDLNVSRIYELVINSSPAYAFLLEGNSFIQNKLVIAHVFAHCDFFRNNAKFKNTSKHIMNLMAVHGERIREYEYKYGIKQVEEFLDAVMAVQEHIDPYPFSNKSKEIPLERETPYDDLWNIGVPQEKEKPPEQKKNPELPEKDILHFIMQNARKLEDWQRDIISILREEMLYFWPQIETKIMNEGWASYWHVRIMRELFLTEEESFEFAKTNAYILQPSQTQLNPYLLGVKIWESIFESWEKTGQGKEKIFEIRENETDVSFIRNYLTKDLVEELDLYIFEKLGQEWQITDKGWKNVRAALSAKLNNGGFPYIVVEDGDYQNNGHLYLRHSHEGVDLDIPYLEKTLPHINKLWGKTVHLETMIEGKGVLFSYDGEKTFRKTL